MTSDAAMSTGSCPVCGRSFTCRPHQIPRRRYCCERCRKTAWRRRHPGHSRRLDPVPPAVSRPAAVPRPAHVVDAVAARAEPAARCPHCARPVAVITLLVAPAAAQVPAPAAGHD
jgi:endogenous inhibitor of DNA gyrase (YacG/DUF329 family)